MNDLHFMGLALREAETALASGEFPVGCILVKEGNVVASGARTGTAGEFPNEVDHAEIIALRRLSRRSEPFSGADLTLFSTMEPCLMCFGAILLCGIHRIVFAYEDVMGGGTGCDRSGMPPLYRASPVIVTGGVCREESLDLFKDFFSNPSNFYWKDSLLARYTLDQ